MAKDNLNFSEVSVYDPWKTVKKFFTALMITLVPIILLFTISFMQEEEFPPEIAVYIPLIVAVLTAILNLWKHYNDTETVIEITT